MLKKSEAQHEQPEDGCPFGPLTQRLLQALVEVRGFGSAQWPCEALSLHQGEVNLSHVLCLPGKHHLPCGGLAHSRDCWQGLRSRRRWHFSPQPEQALQVSCCGAAKLGAAWCFPCHNRGRTLGASESILSAPRSVPHTKSLEGRIKEELVAQGLLESEDRPAEDSEDEVLAELRKRQAELKALSAHNRAKKHELLR